MIAAVNGPYQLAAFALLLALVFCGNPPYRGSTWQEKAWEAKRRNEALQAEQGQIVRTAKNAATGAAVAAVIGIAITLLA